MGEYFDFSQLPFNELDGTELCNELTYEEKLPFHIYNSMDYLKSVNDIQQDDSELNPLIDHFQLQHESTMTNKMHLGRANLRLAHSNLSSNIY